MTTNFDGSTQGHSFEFSTFLRTFVGLVSDGAFLGPQLAVSPLNLR
jgi:hypothetical protein